MNDASGGPERGGTLTAERGSVPLHIDGANDSVLGFSACDLDPSASTLWASDVIGTAKPAWISIDKQLPQHGGRR